VCGRRFLASWLVFVGAPFDQNKFARLDEMGCDLALLKGHSVGVDCDDAWHLEERSEFGEGGLCLIYATIARSIGAIEKQAILRMAVIYQARQARCSISHRLNLGGRVGHSGAGVDAGDDAGRTVRPMGRGGHIFVTRGITDDVVYDFALVSESDPKIVSFVLENPRFAEVRRCFLCVHSVFVLGWYPPSNLASFGCQTYFVLQQSR